jgi:hypothetical protein
MLLINCGIDIPQKLPAAATSHDADHQACVARKRMEGFPLRFVINKLLEQAIFLVH